MLLNDTGGNTPAFADRDALAPRPHPDPAAAIAAYGGTAGPAAVSSRFLARQYPPVLGEVQVVPPRA
jgi:hypothetical protein